MNVLVVGGGIQGMACAAALARDGHNVQLIERERPGQRASWVAAGLLTPTSPWSYPRALIGLCVSSAELYGDFVRELHEHTGVDAQLDDAGVLYPVRAGAGADEITQVSRRRTDLGFETRWLEREALDGVQPGLGDEVIGAGWQAHGTRVRPPRLMRALRLRMAALDVAVADQCAVTGLVLEGGRCAGVSLAGGRTLEADVVVLAAGAWSASLAETASVPLEVRPVRGQILLLSGPPGLLGPAVIDGHRYLVPRRDGRILVGSTMEEAGYDAVTTGEALVELRAFAEGLVPACADLPTESSWAGLRPATPDRMPYLGEVDGVPGLVLATGHHRNGILLAPLTARLVAEVVGRREPSVDLSPFAPRDLDPERLLVGS